MHVATMDTFGFPDPRACVDPPRRPKDPTTTVLRETLPPARPAAQARFKDGGVGMVAPSLRERAPEEAVERATAARRRIAGP